MRIAEEFQKRVFDKLHLNRLSPSFRLDFRSAFSILKGTGSPDYQLKYDSSNEDKITEPFLQIPIATFSEYDNCFL